ncbi:hypothetical protein CALCODRAFT_144586 [Calocera cornea HHB12733]|uniref:Protein CPL1-like domain-containing protein n=1 Tax=Calocera cornea HHB12733 TaxID=1353952 RepID=A0A165CSA7_9BASI|nr:hypothetical protein CALCODRAFT_144586 [Calocera cornea HHB12733]
MYGIANLVNQRLAVTISGAGPVTIGIINACLCLSGILNFEQTNIVAQAAIAVSDEPTTTAALTALVNAHGSVCVYPANASPQCLSSDPCSFSCTNGFTLSEDGTDCVCELPKTVAGGQCVMQSTMRKRSFGTGMSGCSRRERACGVPGQPDAWECVDTSRALDSCGGCLFSPPEMLLSPHGWMFGQDCTDIPHVLAVECRMSKCVVHQCRKPYRVSADRSVCEIPPLLENHRA